MTNKKKTRADLEAELKSLRNARLSEGFVSVAKDIVRYGTLVLIVRYVYLSIDSLAGRQTLADVGFTILGNVNVSVVIAWGAGAAGLAYGWQQRKLRRDTIEYLQRRNIELESELDPNRTSSSLTPRGDTRPEDQL